MPNGQNEETIPDEPGIDEETVDDQTWPDYETLAELEDLSLDPYSTVTGLQ